MSALKFFLNRMTKCEYHVFLKDLRVKISDGLIGGIPVLPREISYQDVVVQLRNSKELLLKIRSSDCYLVAYKTFDGLWKSIPASKSDNEQFDFLGSEATRVGVMSNYHSLFTMAGYHSKENLTLSSESLIAAAYRLGKDVSNPTETAKSILQFLYFIPESARFTRFEQICGNSFDYVPPHVFTTELDSLAKSWKQLSILAATDMPSDYEPKVLTSRNLNVDDEVINSLGQVRGLLKLLHSKSDLPSERYFRNETCLLKHIERVRVPLEKLDAAMRALMFARQESTSTAGIEEHGFESTTISDVLKAKGKGADGSWLWCTTDDSVYDAVQSMTQHNVGALVVVEPGEENSIAGIITERDYLRKIIVQGRSSKSTKVGDIMTEENKLITVKPDTKVLKAMQLMTDNRIRHIPVINEGEMIGMVSIGDVVRAVVSAHRDELNRLNAFIQGGY